MASSDLPDPRACVLRAPVLRDPVLRDPVLRDPVLHAPVLGTLSRRSLLAGGITGIGLVLGAGCGLVPSGSGSGSTEPRTSSGEASSTAAPSSGGIPTTAAAPAGTSLMRGWNADPELPMAGLKRGVVAGPHLSVIVDVAIAAELPAAWRWQVGKAQPTDPAWPAPAGHEWLMLVARASAPLIPTSKNFATAQLTTANGAIDFGKLLGGYQQASGFTNRIQTLAFVVPQNSAANLVITDVGKKAGFDLRTGKAGTDADTQQMLSALQTGTIAVAPAKITGQALWSDGTNTDTVKVSIATVTDKCFLSPWLTTTGWAKPGRTWLSWQVLLTYSSQFPMPLSLDPAKHITLTTGGASSAARGTPIDLMAANVNLVDGSRVIFDVPTTFTQGQLKIVLPPSIQVKYREGVSRTLPLKGAPMTATLTVKPRG